MEEIETKEEYGEHLNTWILLYNEMENAYTESL